MRRDKQNQAVIAACQTDVGMVEERARLLPNSASRRCMSFAPPQARYIVEGRGRSQTTQRTAR
jgi:hypothetical protein